MMILVLFQNIIFPTVCPQRGSVTALWLRRVQVTIERESTPDRQTDRASWWFNHSVIFFVSFPLLSETKSLCLIGPYFLFHVGLQTWLCYPTMEPGCVQSNVPIICVILSHVAKYTEPATVTRRAERRQRGSSGLGHSGLPNRTQIKGFWLKQTLPTLPTTMAKERTCEGQGITTRHRDVD